MKKIRDAVNSFLCEYARLEICYGFIFLAILTYVSSLPHTGNILLDSREGVILLFGLITFLFRKDIPGILLSGPYVLYTVNTFLTALTVDSVCYRGYHTFLLVKGVVCVLVFLYAIQIIHFQSALPWRHLVRFSLVVFGILLVAELIFKMDIFIDVRIPVNGVYGAMNEGFSEIFFLLFFLYMILPKSLELNREKFIHLFHLFWASVTASVIVILIFASIIGELPRYTIFFGLLIPFVFIFMSITGLLRSAYRRQFPAFSEEANRLFYSKEVVQVTERYEKIVDNLKVQLEELRELRENSNGAKKEQIAVCISDLEDEMDTLLYDDLEPEDLDEIEEEIRRIVYQGTRKF